MSNLWLFYNQYYQRVPLGKDQAHSLSVGPDVQQTVTVREFPFTKGLLDIDIEENRFVIRQNETLIFEGTTEEPFELEDRGETLKVFLTSSEVLTSTYYMGYQQEISFSADNEDAVFYKKKTAILKQANDSFQLLKTGGRWRIESQNAFLFVNGQKVEQNMIVEIGDIIFSPFMEIRLLDVDLIEITSLEKYATRLPLIRRPQSEMSKKYPIYRRTPRMIYELPEEKVSLSFPTQESDDSNRGLWLIIMPPLIMLMVMGIVAIIQPRGIFIIVSMVMFMTTLVTSSVQFFKDKQTRKKQKERRHRVYTLYLENKRKELQELAEKQKYVLDYHFPSFERMKYLTGIISDRIWERPIESYDFLQFRLGTGTVPSSYQVSVSSGDMANREIDNLLEQSQVLEKVYQGNKTCTDRS